MSISWTKVYLYCFKYFISIVRILHYCFLTVLFSGRKLTVIPIDDPILLKSATTLASEIRQGKIKSEDVVRSCVKRIKEVNPFVNAICDERFEAALQESREVDELIASCNKSSQQLEEEKPLLGIPFTVKILISVKGMPHSAGCLLRKDLIAYEDAEVVALMKNAGAICLATTNSPEFGLNLETCNSIYGRTSNPYDTSRTAGGSSGGEGALIGSGGSFIGIGNDSAGSIRHPSNFNGIFGHKPSGGLTSNKGLFPIPPLKMNNYVVIGPMCRYAEDLALTMKVMCGLGAEKVKFYRPINFSKLMVHYVLDDGDLLTSNVSSEVKDTVIKAVHYFQSTYSINPKRVELRGMRQAVLTFYYIFKMALGEQTVEDVLTAGKFKLNPTIELIKAIFGKSNLSFNTVLCLNNEKFSMVHKVEKYPVMIKRLENFRKELEAILDENTILILPSFACTAHYHYESIPLLLNISFMCMFNILQLPVTQCPAGLSKDGLPLGFQIAGAKGQDHLTIACALEMEKAFGGWVPPNSKLVCSK